MWIKPAQYNLDEFRAAPVLIRKKGNQGGKTKHTYKDIISAFDIETTTISEIEQSVMYCWQWQIGDETIFGRTWYEFRQLIRQLNFILEQQDAYLVVFVHNLSYEYEYLSGILDFEPENVFAVDRRKILKATYKHIEFRCSYLQTNMNLRAFCEKMNVKHYKLRLNYNKRRYWYTPLTDKEIAYCLNDVRGLCEAIKKEMERDGDTLYTIPLTSTGYARRDAKRAMRYVGRSLFDKIMPNIEIYELLHEAFRGGNTHANRYYVDRTLTEKEFGRFHSADRASSYPCEICNSQFPMSEFKIIPGCTYEQLEELVFTRGKACLIRCHLSNVKLRDPYWPVPYIARSKCRGLIHNAIYDNGRILEADYIEEITITDIDLKILAEEYDFELYPITVAAARYGMLPEELRKTVFQYYQNKTDLKDKDSDEDHTAEFYELLYNKSKNLLNAQYGMMAQNPVKKSILYDPDAEDLFSIDESKTVEDLLEAHNKRAFVCYQWGVWVTAWARYQLEQGIKLCHDPDHGSEFLYCDTDSCKYIGEVDWSAYNEEQMEISKKNRMFAVDPHGKAHYMGVFEREDKVEATEFKTMGAKKYAYRTLDGKLHITIAGVNKKIGAIELERAGGLDAMHESFKFIYAGGLQAKYNDRPELREWINEDGEKIQITRNTCLLPNTKTLGITAEYRELITSSNAYQIDL